MDDATAVRVLLDAAGISPPQADVDELVHVYPLVRGLADMLWSVDEARYESPALRFEPVPRHTDWW